MDYIEQMKFEWKAFHDWIVLLALHSLFSILYISLLPLLVRRPFWLCLFIVKIEHWTLNIANETIQIFDGKLRRMHIFQITKGHSSASFHLGFYIFGYGKCFVGWSERKDFLFWYDFHVENNEKCKMCNVHGTWYDTNEMYNKILAKSDETQTNYSIQFLLWRN